MPLYDDNYLKAIEEIRKIYKLLNDEFFSGELYDIPIFITPNLRKISCFNGETVTVYKRRLAKNGHINLSDHILSLPIEDVCAILIHDMCHYYCYIKNIKDTSRCGQYHNKRFMNVAKSHGLIVSYDNKRGFDRTTPSKKLLDWCAANFTSGYSLDIFRYNSNGISSTTSNSVRFICPKCGSIARKTDRKRIGCWECKVEMLCTTPVKIAV